MFDELLLIKRSFGFYSFIKFFLERASNEMGTRSPSFIAWLRNMEALESFLEGF